MSYSPAGEWSSPPLPGAAGVVGSLSAAARHSFKHATDPPFPDPVVIRRTSNEIPVTVTLKGLLRVYCLDWLVVAILLIAALSLSVAHPYERVVTPDALEWLRYPRKSSTVPSWGLPVFGLLVPGVVIVGFYIRQRNLLDLHHAALGLLFAVFLTNLVTNATKVGTGRLRPDFFGRCFPDGKEAYGLNGGAVCSGKASELREGRKSFPSGHASYCMAGLAYLSFYLAGKLGVFDKEGRAWKLIPVIAPLLGAVIIGVTRTEDYKHHWSDVVAGLGLGVAVSFFAYRQHFPAPWAENRSAPYMFQDGAPLELAPLRRGSSGSTQQPC